METRRGLTLGNTEREQQIFPIFRYKMGTNVYYFELKKIKEGCSSENCFCYGYALLNIKTKKTLIVPTPPVSDYEEFLFKKEKEQIEKTMLKESEDMEKTIFS